VKWQGISVSACRPMEERHSPSGQNLQLVPKGQGCILAQPAAAGPNELGRAYNAAFNLPASVRGGVVGFSKSFRVIPGHPILGIFSDQSVMLYQRRQIIERIDFGKAAGVDQAHEQITDESAMFGFEEQTVFPMKYGPFQNLFAAVIVQRRTWNP